MSSFEDLVPEDFSSPTALPKSAEQTKRWQDANRRWWERHPMTYDWRGEDGAPLFSQPYFDAVDARFFQDAWQYMPWKQIPFDPLIDFDALRERDVLEVGVGCGSHAGLLARHARTFTGIDLTEFATNATSARMKLAEISTARILRMDAEAMEFPDASFDFVWSWGVIHHSANTETILREIARVLRPGGAAVTMVYHRNAWNWYVWNGLFQGILRGDLLKTRSIHRTMQRHTDGALARYFTRSEWRELVSRSMDVQAISVFGQKPQLVPLPGGKAKDAVLKLVPNGVARFLANRARLGTFLVSRQTKRASLSRLTP